uniref:Uncharacterized protein n=1 Tax=Arundo donax TaxID=35708 RepID=A0A0A9B2H0_ARUDO
MRRRRRNLYQKN